MRQERVNHHAPRQTDDRPNENAAPRARLDNALTTAANANGRKGEENSTTKARTNKNGSSACREGQNNAARFVAETARSPEGINPVSATNFGNRFPDQGCEGMIALPPSGGARLFRPRCTFSSDARKAVCERPSSRNGLRERRICSKRGQRVECSLDVSHGGLSLVMGKVQCPGSFRKKISSGAAIVGAESGLAVSA